MAVSEDQGAASPSDRAVAEALWDEVESDFTDDQRHQAYLQHCTRAGLLAEAARRYRRARDDTDDEQLREVLDKRLSGVAMLAVAQLDAQRREPETPKTSRILTVIVVIFTVAALIGLFRALAL